MGAWGVNSLGNTSDDIEKLWNSEHLKEIRRKMLNNEAIPFCNRNCNDSINSCKRHFGLELIDKASSAILNTKPDGSVDPINFIAWNIIESNKCNFKCSYCNVKYSNRFGEKLETFSDTEAMKDKIFPYLDNIEELWLASGESAIQDSYYDILEELITRNRTDIRLFFITNMSVVNYKGRNIFEILSKFKNAVIFGSIDDRESRLEYIRFGSSYSKILENRIELLKYPSIKFYLQPVISIFNIFSFPDFHRDWYNRGLIGADEVRYYVLDSPSYLQANILPLKYKNKLLEKWRGYQQWIKDNLTDKVDTYPNRCNPVNFIDTLINHISVPKDNLELQHFFTFIDENDKKTGLAFNNVFNEYGDIKCISKKYF